MFSRLYSVYRNNKGDFLWWFFAQLGGIILAGLASFTIWLFHDTWGSFHPNPNTLLITATISLAISGLPYVGSRSSRVDPPLVPWLFLLWALLLMFSYGVIIAMGVAIPKMGERCIWAVAIFILAGSLLWSSVSWLHKRGLTPQDGDRREEPPDRTPPNLMEAADILARDLPTANTDGQREGN